MSRWTDISTHGRQSADRTPRTFELQAGRVSLTVTRLLAREGWYLRCPALGWEAVHLPVDNLEDAKHVSARWVRDELMKAARALCDQNIGDTQPLTVVQVQS